MTVKSTLQNRQMYNNANSDLAQSRILTGTGQEFVQYRRDTAIRIWHNDLDTDFEPHWHSALEIITPMENWYDIIIGDATYHSAPGDIMIIPPGELHALKAPETGDRFIFLFDMSAFSRLHGFAGLQPVLSAPIHITRGAYPRIYDDAYQLLAQMRNEYFTQSEFAELTIYSLMLSFFVKLGTNHMNSIPLFSNSKVHKQKEYAEKFNAVMDYIDTHYMDNLNLDDIANSVGFSKYHFSRLFKEYTNYTFCAYICHRRIKIAEELLEQQDLSITEVALQAGFPSISTFNRLFKQAKGCNPSEYREKNSPPRL
ncbi:MAG: AraC family transcriptional regulator [Butyrivibrio sp.]|nr:AraC family transcriptional regulator [Acetatifactor muris]MCM1559408.1 AraC family transcriptional regulator [Butyrivibrio sp.]